MSIAVLVRTMEQPMLVIDDSDARFYCKSLPAKTYAGRLYPVVEGSMSPEWMDWMDCQLGRPTRMSELGQRLCRICDDDWRTKLVVVPESPRAD